MLAALTVVCLIGVWAFVAVSIHWTRTLVAAHERIALTLERFLVDHRREAEREHEARQMRHIFIAADDNEDITDSTSQE